MDRTVSIQGGRVGAEGRGGVEYAVVGPTGLVQLPAHALEVLPPAPERWWRSGTDPSCSTRSSRLTKPRDDRVPLLGSGAADRPAGRPGGVRRRVDGDGRRGHGGAVGRHPGVAFGLPPGVPLPSAARAAAGAHRHWGLRRLLAKDGLGAEWVDTYTRALAQPGALSAALAWYRAATPFSLQAPQVGVPTLYVWGSGDPAPGPRAAITTGRWVTGAYRFEEDPANSGESGPADIECDRARRWIG